MRFCLTWTVCVTVSDCCPPGAAGHSEGTLCHLWHFTFSTFHHPLSYDVPRPAANAGCLLVSLWCRRRSRASTSTLLPFVKQNNAPCLFRNELLPTEWFHMHIQHCTSLLSHHCLLLLFSFFCELECLTHNHRGAALLFCQRNSILQLHAVKW